MMMNEIYREGGMAMNMNMNMTGPRGILRRNPAETMDLLQLEEQEEEHNEEDDSDEIDEEELDDLFTTRLSFTSLGSHRTLLQRSEAERLDLLQLELGEAEQEEEESPEQDVRHNYPPSRKDRKALVRESGVMFDSNSEQASSMRQVALARAEAHRGDLLSLEEGPAEQEDDDDDDEQNLRRESIDISSLRRNSSSNSSGSHRRGGDSLQRDEASLVWSDLGDASGDNMDSSDYDLGGYSYGNSNSSIGSGGPRHQPRYGSAPMTLSAIAASQRQHHHHVVIPDSYQQRRRSSSGSSRTQGSSSSLMMSLHPIVEETPSALNLCRSSNTKISMSTSSSTTTTTSTATNKSGEDQQHEQQQQQPQRDRSKLYPTRSFEERLPPRAIRTSSLPRHYRPMSTAAALEEATQTYTLSRSPPEPDDTF